MHLSTADFWKLAVASELLAPAECEELAKQFAALKGAAASNARSLAQWLVASGKLTRYQAAVLAAGRPGPFVFGPFVVTARIESGRLARIYRAAYQQTQPVLLVFLSQLSDDPAEHQRLAELARAAATVKNPHVSRTYNVARHRSQTFIVVEAPEGESLAELLTRENLAPTTACQIGFQTALGLVALHAEGRVHGAVCPQNIWISPGPSARLLQFPLVAAEDRLERHEPPLVDYLPPELAAGNARPTAISDIYGLGCTLFEMIARRAVFPGGTNQQKIARHRAEFPQRLDQLDPKIPEELADLVAEMLAKDPLLRCQTATHVAHLLAPFAADTARRPSHPPKAGPGGPAPGYGAWKAPQWQSPPKPSRPRQTATSADESPSKTPARDTPSRGSIEPAIVVGASAKGDADEVASVGKFEVPLVVADAPGVARVAPPSPRSSRTTLIGVMAGGAVVVALAIAAAVANRADRRAEPPSTNGATSATVPSGEAQNEEAAAPLPEAADPSTTPHPNPAVTEVDDDRKTLWASPTAGGPLDLAYLPGGVQVIVALRPAELLATPEGARLFDALGPGGAWIEGYLKSTLMVEPADIEQLLIGFSSDESLAPQAAFVMRVARDVAPEELLAAVEKPRRLKHGRKTYVEGPALAYYFPQPDSARVVVAAPPSMMKPILESDGRPLLRGGFERLLQHADETRHLNVLFARNYLLTDGRDLLAGNLAMLRDPLNAFLDESIDAVLLSAHVGEELYVEFRAVAPIDTPPLELLERLGRRWESMPERLETHVASLAPQPYGRLLVNRFPRMVQLLRDFTRGGVDDAQVVLNAYLPSSAAHNLVLGAELTLLETSGVVQPTATAAAGAAATPRAAASALPVAERLQKKTQLSFDRESLDRCLDILANDLGVEIVILGADLQLEGITKNQSLGKIDQRDQTGEAILRTVLKLANPEGKLVYVVKPGDGSQQTVFITTREAARKRGDPLPPGF